MLCSVTQNRFKALSGGRPRLFRPPPVGGRHTVEFLAYEFLEHHVKPSRKQPAYVENILNHDVLTPDAWKGRDARTIKSREVIELLDGIVARGSRVMANRVAGVLGQMFKFGVHRDIVEANPVQLLYRPGGKESPRDRCLIDDELKALWRIPGMPPGSNAWHMSS